MIDALLSWFIAIVITAFVMGSTFLLLDCLNHINGRLAEIGRALEKLKP